MVSPKGESQRTTTPKSQVIAMSRRHTDWYWSHLNELQKVTFVDPKGKERSFLGHGLMLIGWLCDQARDDDGTVFMSVRSMSEDTGITQRTINKLLAAFLQVGWLTYTGERRYLGKGTPTPVYLVSVGNPSPPVDRGKKSKTQEQKSDLGVSQVLSQVLSPATPLKTVKPLQDKELSENSVSYPYPYPEPDPNPYPEPMSPRTDPAGAGKGKGQGRGDLEQLVTLCVRADLEDRPPQGTPGPRLLDKVARDYRPIVADAVRLFPVATQQDLVTYCVGKRRNEPASNTLLAALQPDMANCPDCKGQGVIYTYPNGPEGGSRPVVCTHETAHLVRQMKEQIGA